MGMIECIVNALTETLSYQDCTAPIFGIKFIYDVLWYDGLESLEYFINLTHRHR